MFFIYFLIYFCVESIVFLRCAALVRYSLDEGTIIESDQLYLTEIGSDRPITKKNLNRLMPKLNTPVLKKEAQQALFGLQICAAFDEQYIDVP